MAEHHNSPSYMAVFIWLAILTVIEVVIALLPFAQFVKAALLIAFALGKAVLVALYFMHLRFETRTLGMIVLTPLVICVLLVFALMPDVGFQERHSEIRSEKMETSH